MRRRPSLAALCRGTTGAAAACALLAACSLEVGAGYAPTPQRPTLSSDTSTTHAGSLEVEGGVSADPGDDFSLPTTFKYGLDAQTEIYLGATLFRSVDVAGNDDAGFGDTVLGARHRFWESVGGPSAAAQLAVKLPTADSSGPLGSGEVDVHAAGILTAPFQEMVSVTGYLEFGLLGDPAGGADLQQLVAVAPTLVLNDELSLFGEFSFLLVDGGPDPALLTLGLARSLDAATVTDFGLVFGLNDVAPDVAVFVGFTTNLGPAFGRHAGSGATPGP